MSAARCETGWGDGLSTRMPPGVIDLHPTPPLRVDLKSELRSPRTPQGEGESRIRRDRFKPATYGGLAGLLIMNSARSRCFLSPRVIALARWTSRSLRQATYSDEPGATLPPARQKVSSSSVKVEA
jgi:hypothetical protein